jgi:hypothetical protein
MKQFIGSHEPYGLFQAKTSLVLLTHAEYPSKYVTELLRDHRCDGAIVSRGPISSGLPARNDFGNVLHGRAGGQFKSSVPRGRLASTQNVQTNVIGKGHQSVAPCAQPSDAQG